MEGDPRQSIVDVRVGHNTRIWNYVNLYKCEIGDDCVVGAFVEIQEGVKIGHRVRIQSHSFVCTGVTIENDVFVGHGVMFVNDVYPPRFDRVHWKPTLVRRGASIGNNSTILPVEIGEGAMIGAGSVVTRNVAPRTIVAGNPARELRKLPDEQLKTK